MIMLVIDHDNYVKMTKLSIVLLATPTRIHHYQLSLSASAQIFPFFSIILVLRLEGFGKAN